MERGEVWWAALPEPTGSGPDHRRPVLIVQADDFNRSRIRTVLAVMITSNTVLARAPGNLALLPEATGLSRPSVANVSQVYTLDKALLTERISRLSPTLMNRIDEGLRLVLGL